MYEQQKTSLRLLKSSLRFVEKSFYPKNQVFVNACELHRTRYSNSQRKLSTVYFHEL